jgi:hypothetical protein
MRLRVRENALCAFLAGVGTATMAWLGLYGFTWSDYDTEARPSFDALTHGHVLEFLRLAPAYGGSLVERAPFALLPDLWGGGQIAVYRMVALPCLLAAAVLGIWLVSQMRAAGAPTLWRAVALGVCVANPLTLRALELGHPEELLGGALCVAAVLLAARERPLWAGLALGLAIANKEWALLAAGPVLFALPPGRRWRCMASAGAACAAVLAPLVLVRSSGFVAGTSAAATNSASVIFKPWQVFWFFGHYSGHALGPLDVHQPGYRVGPAWASVVSHPLILAVGLAFAGALWLRSRRGALPEQQALLALAFVLLVRCLLDTWDESYYLLPFILALLAWEISLDIRRPPVLALASSALVWISFQWLPGHVSADAQAASFLAWTVPLAAVLGVWLYAPGLRSRFSERADQETTVSSLGSRLRTS